MKTHKMTIWRKLTIYNCYLFLGFVLALLFTLDVNAEPDYGEEIIMVSMGDSYSSGEGIPDFYGPADIEKKVEEEDWLAHRSKNSWSGQLILSGLDKEMKEYKVNLKKKEDSQGKAGKWYFVASSGALTKHIFDEEQNKPYDRLGLLKGVIPWRFKDDKNPLPKQAEIFESIKTGEVDYITLTLGGNDVGFADVVKNCALHVTFSEPNDLYNQLKISWDKFFDGPEAIKDKLAETYKKLWAKMGGHGNIIVAGYPQLVSMEGGNSKNVFGFDNAEATAVNVTVSVFNDAIEKIVSDVRDNEHANIYFVSVEDAFINHGAYEEEPYINGIIMPSNNEDLKAGLSSAYSMHPNKKGAAAYARCVQKTIAWIEAGKPSISISGQVTDKNDLPAANLSVTIRTEKARKIVFQGTTNENGEFNGDIKLSNTGLRIAVNNEEKKLIDIPVTKSIEYGNNDLGIIKLDSYEGTMVVETDDQETTDKDTVAALYEQTIADYIQFIKSKNTGNDYQNYIIYDIDKDGYPELLILVGIPEERRSVYEIYSYKSGSFEFQTQCKNCLPHGPAAYASYPNGNGMIAHFSFRGAEGVTLLSLNGHEIVDESLYLEKTEEHPTQFYLDEYDPIYADSYNHNNYLNHQFYVGEAASPYCDGSYLLGQSAMDDFTAVYEAFGVKEDADTSTESSDSAFMGISVLNKGTENNITVNGKSFRIRYDSAESSDRYVGLNLYVNNIAESYRLDSILSPYIENVYVTDIDINDSYYNIAVVISGEDEDCSTYLFAFNDSEINMIQAFNGRLIPESVTGEGTVLLQYVLGMGIHNYGIFCVRPEISVNNLSAEQVDLHSGRMIYSEAGSTYEDEFLVPLSSDLTVYAEPECVSAAGIIPAGTDIKCEYVMHSDVGYLFYVTGASASGYVNSGMLKASCKDLYFAG